MFIGANQEVLGHDGEWVELVGNVPTRLFGGAVVTPVPTKCPPLVIYNSQGKVVVDQSAHLSWDMQKARSVRGAEPKQSTTEIDGWTTSTIPRAGFDIKADFVVVLMPNTLEGLFVYPEEQQCS